MHALTLHRFLLRAALAGVNIFAWIFVFEYFYFVEPSIEHAFARTILLYALSQTITCLATPYTARYVRFGARQALTFATPLAAIAFILLGSVFDGLWTQLSPSFGIVAFAIAIGLYRALYWIPYEVESDAHVRKDTPLFRELLIACAPLVGGLFVASVVSPVLLLYGGSVIIMLSVIPLFFVQNIWEKFAWGYRETFARLLDVGNRRIVTDSFLDGVSGATLLFFWPLAIFLIVGRSFGVLGIVLTLTFCITIILRGVIRTQWRHLHIAESPFLNVVFAITPWLFRLFIATPIGVIIVDSYFYTIARRRQGVDPQAYEQASDGGSYVDEYTALKEVALSLGRITICLLAAIAVSFASLPIMFGFVFLVAALSAAVGVLRLR